MQIYLKKLYGFFNPEIGEPIATPFCGWKNLLLKWR
jgi:hypothetical protein